SGGDERSEAGSTRRQTGVLDAIERRPLRLFLGAGAGQDFRHLSRRAESSSSHRNAQGLRTRSGDRAAIVLMKVSRRSFVHAVTAGAGMSCFTASSLTPPAGLTHEVAAFIVNTAYCYLPTDVMDMG